MELAWELRGYAINIRVLRRREAPGKPVPGQEQIVGPGRTHHPSEKAHEDLLYTSGSRFVGPIR